MRWPRRHFLATDVKRGRHTTKGQHTVNHECRVKCVPCDSCAQYVRARVSTCVFFLLDLSVNLCCLHPGCLADNETLIGQRGAALDGLFEHESLRDRRRTKRVSNRENLVGKWTPARCV